MDASESLPSLPESPGPAGELVVQNGRLAGARRVLTPPLTLIGQGSGCDVRLNVEGVSALHCAIFDDPQGPILRDLDSRTGTVVNGQRVIVHRLVNNDVIEVGPFQFAVTLGPAPTSEGPSGDAVSMEREREALRIQAAAVAAQQAALMEEEGQLQQRETALQRQEAQLASHLQERQRTLDAAEEQLRQDRAAFEEESAAQRARLQDERREADQLHAAAQQDRQKAAQERQRLGGLRRRLRKRWCKQWDGQEARMKKREDEVIAEKQRVQIERARVLAFQERTNSELELGRQQLREEWQELGLAQQQCEEMINREQAEQKRQQQTLELRARQTAEEEATLQAERQRFEQYRAGLMKEVAGLEARVHSQRSRLETLEREAARHESMLNGAAPVVNALTLSPPSESAVVAADPGPAHLRDLAADLHDQRLHLTEQWERLLQVQESWEQERTTALRELECTAEQLAERARSLGANERVVEAAREELQRQHEGVARLRDSLEGWQTRLTLQETSWQAERETVLNQVASRERMLEVRRQQLEEVHQRRNRRRKHEVVEFQAALARCDEARRQHSELWQECERLRETLTQLERTLSSEALVLKRFRLETIHQATDSARVEAQLERLCHKETTRLDAEARDLALERRKLLRERVGLDVQASRLIQLEEELLVRQRDWTTRIAEWESQRAQLEVDEQERQQEVRRLRAQHALNERQLRQLRDEIERIARGMIEEAEAPPAAQQAA